MYIEYNRHPKGLLTSDCVVRAISTAFDIDYIECRRSLNRLKKELKLKTYKGKKFIYNYLKDYERIIFKIELNKPRVSGYDFVKLYPTGTYILNMAHHLTTVIDGNLLDTWNCSEYRIYTAWKIK
jgi:hypothetical protein